MLLRDPVHGLISFEGVFDRLVLALLDTREVQRLRRIRQLGLASWVFPGAEHSRFAHALGAAFVMQRWLERMQVLQSSLGPEHRLDEAACCDAMAASLLHDLGHGPMSHLFEDVLPKASEPRSHEMWTQQIIEDPDTEVHRVLSRWSAGMPDRVAQLVRGKHRLGYLGAAVNGVLDVDRCDYLLRDSHMTGVRYGLYDLDWLIRSFTFVYLEHGEPALAVEGRKGLPPVESFFLARHFMYAQVYHHKATRAAECLIGAIFSYARTALSNGDLLGITPKVMRSLLLGQNVSTDAYLSLDDSLFWSCIQRWSEEGDIEMRGMCRRLLMRHLPKTIPLPDSLEQSELWRLCFERAQAIAQDHGLCSERSVWLDVAEDIPFADHPDARLWVSLRHQAPQSLGSVSFLLSQLRNKRVVRPRLVVPEEIRVSVGEMLDGVLRMRR